MNDQAEFRHFKYLLAILENKGLRAAAEYLRTSEPNLSTQARRFQEDFGLHLFERGKSGRIELTESGIAFKALARSVLDARDEAIAAAVAIERGQIRALNLGCGPFVDLRLMRVAHDLHKKILPNCPIRSTYVDAGQIVQELVQGEIDAAIMTMPVNDPRLCVQPIRRDKLVVCLRADHPLSRKAAILPQDLENHLSIFYDPHRHPEAHQWLMESLRKAGVRIGKFSRASHPTELQSLVKAGFGLALTSEGETLDAELMTLPVGGVDWAVDTVFVYNKELHPKTIPAFARLLSRRLSAPSIQEGRSSALPSSRVGENAKRPPRSEGEIASDSRRRLG